MESTHNGREMSLSELDALRDKADELYVVPYPEPGTLEHAQAELISALEKEIRANWGVHGKASCWITEDLARWCKRVDERNKNRGSACCVGGMKIDSIMQLIGQVTKLRETVNFYAAERIELLRKLEGGL